LADLADNPTIFDHQEAAKIGLHEQFGCGNDIGT
jgi:hypothetical protein